MKELIIFSLRKDKENQEPNIKVESINAKLVISIQYLVKTITITSEKAFPGDDTDYKTNVEVEEFKAEIQSDSQLAIIDKINSVSNPVIQLTYDDSGTINKLESIEYGKQSEDLIKIQNKLNMEYERQKKSIEIKKMKYQSPNNSQ